MITKFKKQVEPIIAIIAYPFLSWNPHLLTSISVLSSILFAFFLTNHNFLLAGISWIGVVFDALDGYVARKRGKATDFGAFFDSTMDRISDFFYITAFGFAGFIPWSLVSLVFLVSLLISYTKARGESLLPKGVQIKEGVMQRTERLVGLFLVFILFLLKIPTFGIYLFSLLFVLNIITVLQRIVAIKKLLN